MPDCLSNTSIKLIRAATYRSSISVLILRNETIHDLDFGSQNKFSLFLSTLDCTEFCFKEHFI